MSRVFAAALACALVAGCGGGPKVVAVSGVVKVDGQPYKNAVVTFQPVATEGNPNPGLGSNAETDDQGRFTLIQADGKAGAVVGLHRVRIQTKREAGVTFFDPGTGSADSDPSAGKKGKAVIDPIPIEWYGDVGRKEFTVPAGGTDQANFDITSDPRAKWKK